MAGAPPPSSVPDVLLIASGAALLLLGPAMAALDYAKEADARAALEQYGERPPFDPTFRDVFRQILLLPLVALAVAGVYRFVRIVRSPTLRRWSKRPLALFLAGSSIADLAYMIDGAWGFNAPYLARALFVDPLYAVAGFLIVGSAWRIRTLLHPLPPGDPEAYGL